MLPVGKETTGGKEPTGKQLVVSHSSCSKERTVLLLLCNTCVYPIPPIPNTTVSLQPVLILFLLVIHQSPVVSYLCCHKIDIFSVFAGNCAFALVGELKCWEQASIYLVWLPLTHTCSSALPHHKATNTTVQTYSVQSHHSPKGSHEERMVPIKSQMNVHTCE